MTAGGSPPAANMAALIAAPISFSVTPARAASMPACMPASVAVAARCMISTSAGDLRIRPSSTMPKQSSRRPSVNEVWMRSWK